MNHGSTNHFVRNVMAVAGLAGAIVSAVGAADPPPATAMAQGRGPGSADFTPWRQLEVSHWIADGRDGARVVYVFTDPNCPYCNKLWSDARPWVTAGTIQLRHVIVGILTPTSPGKAAALLADKDPAAMLAAYEGQNAFTVSTALASGRPRPLADGVLKPLTSIATAQQAQLTANEQLMTSLKLRATPALVWRDEQGALRTRQGLPEGDLASIFGAL